jgi:hypothetical protein
MVLDSEGAQRLSNVGSRISARCQGPGYNKCAHSTRTTTMFAQLFSKRFSKPPPPSAPSNAHPAQVHPNAFTVSPDGHHVAHLPPKHVVPPVPHPSPYARLVLHASLEGLLIRSDVPSRECASYVCVSWNGGGPGGTGVDVSVVSTKSGATWDGPVVYGIVGVITVYQGESTRIFVVMHI